MRRRTATLCACLLAVSCLMATNAASQQLSTTPRVSREEFASLRWLDGRWKGSGGGFAAFYEEYRVLNDSTIEQYEHADSTFPGSRPRSRITWRNGVAAKGMGDRIESRISRIAGDTVRFEFTRPGGGGFTWIRVGPDEWKAILDGRPTTVTYVLRRWGRQTSPGTRDRELERPQ